MWVGPETQRVESLLASAKREASRLSFSACGVNQSLHAPERESWTFWISKWRSYSSQVTSSYAILFHLSRRISWTTDQLGTVDTGNLQTPGAKNQRIRRSLFRKCFLIIVGWKGWSWDRGSRDENRTEELKTMTPMAGLFLKTTWRQQSTWKLLSCN